LDAFSDGLRVLTTILAERRRARRRHRSRRRHAAGTRTAAVLARDLIQIETAFVRMLYVLHSIEHGRSCVHQAKSPALRLRTASPTAVSSGRSHRRTRDLQPPRKI
jgi:hypothetical protein